MKMNGKGFKLKRKVSLLLAALMVMQSCMVYGTDGAQPTAEPETKTSAELDVTPKETTPETTPETKAPETSAPTEAPAPTETQAPTEGPAPTEAPEQTETQAPTESETQKPTEEQTQAPSESETQKPSEEQTQAPSESETQKPTEEQTQAPSESETQKPSEEQTQAPTEGQTQAPELPDAGAGYLRIVNNVYTPEMDKDETFLFAITNVETGMAETRTMTIAANDADRMETILVGPLLYGEYIVSETTPERYDVEFTDGQKVTIGEANKEESSAATLEVWNNRKQDECEAVITHTWAEGTKAPESVSVDILRDGAQLTTVTLNDTNKWTASYPLPRFDLENNTVYTYTVSANEPEGFEATYEPGEELVFVDRKAEVTIKGSNGEAKTEFKYEDENVIITAIVPEDAGLSQEVELEATEMKEGSHNYKKAVEAVEEAENTPQNEIKIKEYIGYNVYFELDNKKVAPEVENIEYTIKYKEEAFDEAGLPIAEYTTYQLNSTLSSAEVMAERKVATANFAAPSNRGGMMLMASGTALINITKGNTYYYSTYGYGSYNTSEYWITSSTLGITKELAICVQPSKGAPGGAYQRPWEDLEDQVLAKILYYTKMAYNAPEDSRGFFYQKGIKEKGQAFIIGHIAAGKRYKEIVDPNGDDIVWSTGTNATSLKLAQELIDWVGDRTEASFTESGTPYIYNDGGKWRKVSQTFTYNDGDGRSFDLTITNGKVHVNGDTVGKEGKVTIKANSTFYLSAEAGTTPIITHTPVTKFGNVTGNMYLIKKLSSGKQDLGLVPFIASDDFEIPVDFEASWSTKELHFTKAGVSGHTLDGTKLAICTDADGNNVVGNLQWDVTDSNPTKTYQLNELNALSPNTQYYLVDKTVAPGYTKTSQPFRLTADGSINASGTTTLTLTNALTQVQIFKKDTANNELSNVQLQLTDSKGPVIQSDNQDTFKSGAIFTGLLVGETYTITEVVTEDGYTFADPIKFTIAADGTVRIREGGGANGSVDGIVITMYDQQIDAKMVKRSVDGADNLLNATYDIFELVSGSENQVGTVTSAAAGQPLTGLKVNTTYRMREVAPPTGYQVMDGYIDFTLDSKGKITNVQVNGQANDTYVGVDSENNTIILRDDLTEVKLSKLAFTNGDKSTTKVLRGAKLQIVDAEGKLVGNHEWDSKAEAYVATGLTVNTQYKLHEVTAPGGYNRAADIAFWIDLDGTVYLGQVGDKTTSADTVEMIDELAKITFVKEANLDKARHDDVLLAVSRDEAGEDIVELNGEELQWTAQMNGEGHDVYGLTPGEYYLVELEAPSGYAKHAQEFTVEPNQEDGFVKLVTLTNYETRVQVGKVFARGEMNANDAVTFEITRKGDEEAAVAATVQVTPATNGGETTTDEQGRKVYWSDVVYSLPVGDYILTETSAPDGYSLAAPVEFTVTADMEADGTDALKVMVGPVVNDVTEIYFAKTDENGMALEKVDLVVYDSNGKVAKTVFGEELKWTTDGTLRKFEGLGKGAYTLHEEKTVDGYTYAADVKFEVGADGKVSVSKTNYPSVYIDPTANWIIVEMRNRKTEIAIDKLLEEKDGTTVPMAGAKLEILDGGNVVEQWTSDGKPHTVKGLKVETPYVLHEAGFADDVIGYTLADDISFQISRDGKLTQVSENGIVDDAEKTLSMVDRMTYISFTKEDDKDVTDEEHKEVTLAIVYADGEHAGEVVSVENDRNRVQGEQIYTLPMDGTKIEVWGLAPGSYQLVEQKTADGYATANPIDIVIGETYDPTLEYPVEVAPMTNCRTRVQFAKVFAPGYELADGEQIVLEVTGGDLEQPMQVVIDNTNYDAAKGAYLSGIIEGMHVGSYTAKEISGPDGFIISKEEIPFTVTDEMDGDDAKLVSVGAITNKATTVAFAKVDEDGEPIEGVKLRVEDKDGNVPMTIATDGNAAKEMAWTTTAEPEVFTGLAKGEYTLKEELALPGYVYAADIPFTVGEDGRITCSDPGAEVTDNGDMMTITMVDYRTKLQITKTMEDGYTLGEGEEIVFELSGPNEVQVGPVPKISETEEKEEAGQGGSGTNPSEGADKMLITLTSANWNEEAGAYLSDVIENLPTGIYSLKEISVPDGFTIANPTYFTISDQLKNGEVQVAAPVVENEAIEIDISKVDIANVDHELAGAHLQVLEVLEDGTRQVAKTVYGEEMDWTSGEDVRTFKGVRPGNYVLVEETAPRGFTVAEEIEFTVDENLTVEKKHMDLQMKDESTYVELSKKAITGDGELAGATLQVLDENGEVAVTEYGERLEWTSTEEQKVVRGLAAGTYKLHEVISPDGYALANDIEFTITDELGLEQTVEMTDDYTKVEVEKLNESGTQLAGATLRLTDADGNLVEEWVTDGKRKDFTGKLVAGKTYTLTETKAPDGFKLAAPITFTVASDGSEQVITMVDDVSGTIEVQKVVIDAPSGDLIPLSYSFYTALFSDEALNNRVSDVKELKVENATSTSVTFDNLPVGVYYVAETTETGNPKLDDPYIVSNEITKSRIEITPEAASDSTVITNYVDMPLEYYMDGELTLNKKVVINGKPGKVTDVFYFALFEDEAKTKMLEDIGIYAIQLKNQSEGSIVVEHVPYGTWYVAETDANGVPVKGGFEYDVTLDKDHFTLDATKQTETVTVTNSKEGESEYVETEITSEVETETEIESDATVKAVSVKTGDNTPIIPLMILLVVSALVVLVLAAKNKKRRGTDR